MDDYETQLRKTAVDLLLLERRSKQDQELQQSAYVSDEERPNEELIRKSMGLPAEKQTSQANPELTKIRKDLEDIERGIVELHEDTDRRIYRDHPGLLEERLRQKMGLPEAGKE